MAYSIDGMVSGADEISALFGNPTEIEENTETQEIEETETPEQTKKKEVTEAPASIEDLFGSEKVGNEDTDTEGEEEAPQNNSGSSPANLYSSIANSLAEDGALSNLSEDELNEIRDSESLINAFKKQQETMLDETTKRVNDALNAGVKIPVIQQYENGIKYLNDITTDMLEAETPESENIRKQIIYQYQINLGVNEQRAQKEVERALSSGTDIEDAKEYLESLKENLKGKYNQLIEEGKQQMQAKKKAIEENAKKLQKTMLEDEKVLGDIVIDKTTRQKAFDILMKPTYRRQDGTYQSELQKYIEENTQEFQMKVSLLYAMTDGFKKMGNIMKETVKKEKKKALRELENVVNNTQRTPSGSINMNPFDGNATFRGKTIAPPELWK